MDDGCGVASVETLRRGVPGAWRSGLTGVRRVPAGGREEVVRSDLGIVLIFCGARVAERQTRWLQVPVSERAWGFKSPLAHTGLFV